MDGYIYASPQPRPLEEQSMARAHSFVAAPQTAASSRNRRTRNCKSQIGNWDVNFEPEISCQKQQTKFRDFKHDRSKKRVGSGEKEKY
jgi:hypothetical protein